MYLEYNIIDTIKLFIDIINNYSMIKAIFLSGILLIILLFINSDNKKIKYIIFILYLILIMLLLYYYGNNLFDGFESFINNLYGYIFSSIVVLILIPILYIKNILNKRVLIIEEVISIVFITSLLYITHTFNNNTLLILGDTYPLVKIGNLTYIIYIIILLIVIIRRIYERKANK